jgi:hypothetical protein
MPIKGIRRRENSLPSAAGKSIFFFSFWVLLCALALLVVPDRLVNLLGIVMPDTLVARIFGMVLLFMGYYYLRSGLDGTLFRFYRWTVQTRIAAMPIAVLFVLSGWANPFLILFVGVDLAGAIWTLLALLTDRKVDRPRA